MDTDDETPGDADQGLYGVFPTRVLGRVSGDDTRVTKSSVLRLALRHAGKKSIGALRTTATSSSAKAMPHPARKVPKKARGSIRESLGTTPAVVTPPASEPPQLHPPQLRAAKCKAAATSGMAKTSSPATSSDNAENQRRLMNARCAELLEAQRAAFRRKVELRKEAIRAAFAKAKAAPTFDGGENGVEDAYDDTMHPSSGDRARGGATDGDVQPGTEFTSGFVFTTCYRVVSLMSELTFPSGKKHGAISSLRPIGLQDVNGFVCPLVRSLAIVFELWLILPYLWMSDEPGVVPPTRAETNYFLNFFPRPSQMQKEQPVPMDTKDQPKRGIFEDTSTREESLPKAMKGETQDGANSPREPVGPRASASLTPVKTPVGGLPTPTPTTASPASTLTPQQQLLPDGNTTTPPAKGKSRKGKQGKGQGKGQKGGSGPSQATSSSSHQDNVISAMGRLCLRHEDAIAVQRANQGYVWWLRTAGPESIVPSLARVSAAWNRKKDEEGVQDHPLRIVMLSTLLEVMIERAQAAVEPSRLEASAQAGLILNQGDEPFWPFLRWNPARRIEEVVSSEEMRPLKHTRLMRKLNQVRDTITPENILRCHGYHSITENMTGDTWRLLLEIETVGEEAQNLHAWLRRMINCTAWKLIGGRFRRERLGRSPLANRLAELLG
ncbi:unnamed protein product [Symbiodinium sp. KB8]|nr:unnamed protein product [Symbiodinium sp. KB8]